MVLFFADQFIFVLKIFLIVSRKKGQLICQHHETFESDQHSDVVLFGIYGIVGDTHGLLLGMLPKTFH